MTSNDCARLFLKKNPNASFAKASSAMMVAGVLSASVASQCCATSVTSCSDDPSDTNTLRNVVATATSGATIDFVGLPSCTNSTITLEQGEITITQPDLKIVGPANQPLAIEGHNARIFHHAGTATGTLALSYLTIANGYYSNSNLAINQGGCIASNGNLSLNSVNVSACSVKAIHNASIAKGGALYAAGNVTLTSSTVTGSHAVGRLSGLGGGIYAHGRITATYSSISGNTAQQLQVSNDNTLGGGFYAYAGFTAVSATVSTNQVIALSKHSSGGGGFVYSGGMFATGSTFDGNRADERGGGLYVENGNATIFNSTFASNQASQATAMQALYYLFMSNSTVAFNKGSSAAATGYAIYDNSSMGVRINSSLIAKNTSGTANIPADLYVASNATIAANGTNNLIMAARVSSTPANFITVSIDPQLSTLANNGGYTRTIALQAGSPAIGVGNNNIVRPTDQRGLGHPRTNEGKTDIGAIEFDLIFVDGLDPIN